MDLHKTVSAAMAGDRAALIQLAVRRFAWSRAETCSPAVTRR